jgi:hypothetical protein
VLSRSGRKHAAAHSHDLRHCQAHERN